MKFCIAVTTIYVLIASMIKKNSFLNVFSDNPLRIRWPIAIPKIAGTTETEDHIPIQGLETYYHEERILVPELIP